MEKTGFGTDEGPPAYGSVGPHPAAGYDTLPAGSPAPPAGGYAPPPAGYAPLPTVPAGQYGPPPQYSYGQQTVVTVPRAPQTVIVRRSPVKPPDYMWLSCLVYWCCNCLFGAIAIGLSVASTSAAEENRMEEARNYGKASLWVSVSGAIFGLVVMVSLVVMYVSVWNEEKGY